MGNPTHEEKIDKQKLDDGDLDEDVWYYRSPDSNHYHEDPQCVTIYKPVDEMKSTTRKMAHRRWLAPCSRCVLNK